MLKGKFDEFPSDDLNNVVLDICLNGPSLRSSSGNIPSCLITSAGLLVPVFPQPLLGLSL